MFRCSLHSVFQLYSSVHLSCSACHNAGLTAAKYRDNNYCLCSQKKRILHDRLLGYPSISRTNGTFSTRLPLSAFFPVWGETLTYLLVFHRWSKYCHCEVLKSLQITRPYSIYRYKFYIKDQKKERKTTGVPLGPSRYRLVCKFCSLVQTLDCVISSGLDLFFTEKVGFFLLLLIFKKFCQILYFTDL